MRSPELTIPSVHEPVNLVRTIQTKLSRLLPSSDALRSVDELELGRAILAHLRVDPTCRLTRASAKALISLASEVESPGDRRVISRAILVNSPPGWRQLWRLWVSCHEDNPRVAMVLGDRLAKRVAERPKFDARLPTWLRGDPRQIRPALAAPEDRLREYVLSQELPLWDIHRACEIPPSSRLGAHVAQDLVRAGPTYWWTSMNPLSLRDWASQQPLPVIAAVAERTLLSFAGDADSPVQLPKTEDRPHLKSWILQRCGDPVDSPAVWAHIDPRAKQIFEWLLVGDEIEKIFNEFRRSAESARAEYWQRYIPQMRDARYYESYSTSVCMMVVGDALAIEFGKTGNACYFYRAPSIPLRSLKLPRKARAEAFKLSQWQQRAKRAFLELGQATLEFHSKKSHTKHWEADYDQLMREVGCRIPSRRRR